MNKNSQLQVRISEKDKVALKKTIKGTDTPTISKFITKVVKDTISNGS